MKEDALWLSKEAAIDEVTALRVTILEWQQRVDKSLLSRWHLEEIQGLEASATAPSIHAISELVAINGGPAESSEGGDVRENETARRTSILLLHLKERQFLLKAVEALAGLSQRPELQLHSKAALSRTFHLGSAEVHHAAEAIWKAQSDLSVQPANFTVIERCISSLRSILDLEADPAQWPSLSMSDNSVAVAYIDFLLEQLLSILRLTYLHAVATPYESLKAAEINAWYALVQDFGFFATVSSLYLQHRTINDPILALVSLMSVEVLRLTPTTSFIDAKLSAKTSSLYPDLPRKSYIEDENCIKDITNCLWGAATQDIRTAAPAILAWTIICQALRTAVHPDGDTAYESSLTHSRRNSFRDSGSQKRSKPELLLKAITDVGGDQDTIAQLGHATVDRMQVFELLPNLLAGVAGIFLLPIDTHTVICCRLTVLEIVRHATPSIAYGPEIVTTLLATLTHYTEIINIIDPRHALTCWPLQPAQSLHEDQDVLGPQLMAKLVSRYPFELDGFLACLSAVARSTAYSDSEGSQIARMLEDLPNFTTILPIDFTMYELVQDDDIMNRIQITQDLPLLVPHGHAVRSKAKIGVDKSRGHSTGHIIPTGSIGAVLNDSKPFIVSWQYQHSGLAFLGALLSTLRPNAQLVDARIPADLDVESAGEIINLLNSMLIATISSKDRDASQQLLFQLSNGLLGSDDIVRVVFDIFEDQLQIHMNQPGSEGSIIALTRMIEFARLILEIHPERVWNMLAKSRLLPMDDNSGALSTIVGSTEAPMGRFRFLGAFVSLFRSLIEDCLDRAVTKQTRTETRALARFEESTSISGRTPEKTTSSLLFNFSRVVLDVLQSQPNWRFVDPQERNAINTSILDALTQLLEYAYATSSGDATANRLFHTFQAAAANVGSIYLLETTPDMPVQALIDIFINALVSLATTSDSRDNHGFVAVTVKALKFCTSLIRVGILQARSGTALKKHLLRAMSLLARLYIAHEAFKPHVAELLTVLMRYSDVSSEEPPSLLGFLPTGTTKLFLAVIADISKPLQNLETEALIWDMLSAVVSHRQQWLAISLLTGSTPRDRLKNDDPNLLTANKSLVNIVLETLAGVSSLPPRRALAMLAFLSHAQRRWSWISTRIMEHPQTLDALTDLIASLSTNAKPQDVEVSIRKATENQLAAFIADILARFLHNISGAEKTNRVKTIMAKLRFLRDHATSVDGYNHSLHRNLAKNFEQRFPLCSLSDIKRGSFESSQLGTDYCYDLTFADRVLGFDPSWKRSKGQGFVDEIARANVNFSLVDSQIALLKSWKTLALEVCTSIDQQGQDDMLVVIIGCLKANIETTIPAQLFENVSEIRAEFAFALLQRLVRSKQPSNKVKEVFVVAWDTVRQSGIDFEVISDARDANYYRLLMQILFLSLQPHSQDASSAPTLRQPRESLSKSATTMPSPLTPLGTTFLEIINKAISTNLRALCSSVHAAGPDTASIAEPSDFVLLTALLQAILRTSTAAGMHRQITTAIAESGMIRYATSLYSWSDSLTPEDPIYGELSVLFLLTLSSVPMVAEQMAVEGVLSSLTTANLSQHFRSRTAGKGPFDSPARLHAIWARGLLPLSLNLLSAVGPAIAAEVSGFVNSFPAQLARAESDLASSPSPSTPHRGRITLNLAAELHSIALLSAAIDAFRARGAAAAGLNPADVDPVAIDRAAWRELIDEALKSRRALRERIVPLGEREVALARTKAKTSDSESALEALVVAELRGALSCLESA